MNTDLYRLALRPDIPTEPALSPAEQFQNDILRPILKFQHSRLMALFTHHIQKKKIRLDAMEPADRKKQVEKMVQNDQALRNQLVGCILGLLTEMEWMLYIQAEKELSRRLHQLLIQRIQSALE